VKLSFDHMDLPPLAPSRTDKAAWIM